MYDKSKRWEVSLDISGYVADTINRAMARQDPPMTREKLAELSGIHPSSLARLLNGQHSRELNLYAVWAVFNVLKGDLRKLLIELITVIERAANEKDQ
jgi:transcriptional regulator with XRE-family HTH domain